MRTLEGAAATVAIVWAVSADHLLEVGAVAVMVAGVLVAARFKAALETAVAASESWESLAHSREERLTQTDERLRQAVAQVAALEARPDLSGVALTMTRLVDLITEHERQANVRNDRLLQGLEAVAARLERSNG